MKLTKRSAMPSTIEMLRREMDQFFDDVVPFSWHRENGGNELRTWSPNSDISEDEHEYMIRMDIPGMEKENIKVNYQDGRLTITGGRKMEEKIAGLLEEYTEGRMELNEAGNKIRRLILNGTFPTRLNTALKFPLADPKSGYGTGEWDYGAGVSGSQQFGNYFLMVYLMKWWFGDMPDMELDDPFTYSVGFGRTLVNGKWMIHTTYSGYTEIIEGYDPPLNLNFGVGFFASDRISLNSTLTLGLSESASDFSLGFGWSVRL